MKKKKLAVLVMLSLCLIGCGRGNADQQNIGTQISVQNVETTERYDTTQESIAEVDTTTLTIAEKIRNLVLAGHEVGMPCRYGEFTKYFNITHLYSYEEYPDIAYCMFEYNGQEVGSIYVKCAKDSDHMKDTDWVFSVTLYDINKTGMLFQFCNVNENSTVDDVVENLGEPTEKDDFIRLSYIDDSKTGKELYKYDGIIFYFNTENEMDECTVFYNINNLEEE